MLSGFVRACGRRVGHKSTNSGESDLHPGVARKGDNPGIVDLQSPSSAVVASVSDPPDRDLGRRVECNSTIPGVCPTFRGFA